VSGRSIDDLDALFAPLRLPASGVHGCERREANGCLVRPVMGTPELAHVRDEIAAFVARDPGLLLEDKHYGVAVHFRLVPHLRGEVFNFMRELCRRLGPTYRLQAGKCVLEVRMSGYSKGTSIAEFMQEEPFRGRTPGFIGDDVTDEEGFAVVNKLEGVSVKVGDADSTLAQHRLTSVREVLAWLESMPPPALATAALTGDSY
jgi:trehalose 6-phosphate phosphatase